MLSLLLRLIFLLLPAGSLVLAGCEVNTDGNWEKVRKDIRSTFPGVKQISTEELQAWLTAQDSVRPLLIDRREAEEYAVSHLQGAFHADDMEDALKIIEKEGKDRPIVVYCSVGYRSSVLARKLGKAGFTNNYNLEGSIFKWANEGRPLYRGDRQVHVVHSYDSKWRKFLNRKLWYIPPKQ
ncbi:MAG: rhodanese-like domain-containing protein [Nitrospirae bacterium]|nr:rhodanese-like domain-containing protein [Nitrospirota bacterium]